MQILKVLFFLLIEFTLSIIKIFTVFKFPRDQSSSKRIHRPTSLEQRHGSHVGADKKRRWIKHFRRNGHKLSTDLGNTLCSARISCDIPQLMIKLTFEINSMAITYRSRVVCALS